MAKNVANISDLKWIPSDSAIQNGVALINRLINTDGAHVYLSFKDEDGTERTIRLKESINIFSYMRYLEE